MPHYKATVYRKDADTGKRQPLGSEQIKADTPQQVRKQVHDQYWDESMALIGGRLEIEVEVLKEQRYQATLMMVGPDGSHTLIGEEAVWDMDEESAIEQLRQKGAALIGGSAFVEVQLVGT